MKPYLQKIIINNRINGSITKILIASVLTVLIIILIDLSVGKTSSSYSLFNKSVHSETGPSQEYGGFPPSTNLFLKQMSLLYPESYTTNNGIAEVAIRKKSTYHLNIRTTYQEVVTANQLIKTIITHKLDEQGIEYQLWNMEPENSDAKWIISWGGILYLPKI
jgi:hypothetical protein